MTSINTAGTGPTGAGTGPIGDVTDRALRVFATAARAGTFTRASTILGIGQPAVSHAVQRLETALGTRLMHRSRTGVELTSAGQLLLDQLEPAFDQIDLAIAPFTTAEPAAVTISVSTSFASWWLLPRLPEFKRAHPAISLRLMTADSDFTTNPNDIDLWIPLGRIDRPDLEIVELCREALIPVAAPDVATRYSGDPTSLLTAPLLHLEERYESRFDWPRWFAANNIDVPDRLAGDRSNDYSLVVQAALDGQGVALGWEHIVADLIDDGRLLAIGQPIVTQTPFVVLSSKRKPLSPNAAALRSWLVAELATAT